MTPRGVLAFCREKEVRAIDVRFTDVLGRWQHLTIPVSRLSEASFEQGFPLNTAMISASSAIDLLVIPHAESAFLDPFATTPTLILIGTLQNPITREDDSLDSRVLAQRAINFLQGTGIADRVQIASKCEFYLFNDVQVAMAPWSSSIRILPHAADYSPNASSALQREFRENSPADIASNPADSSLDFRNAVMELLTEADTPVGEHFPIGASGQAAMAIDSSDLVVAADAIMKTKFMARGAAERQGRLATFLPMPLAHHRGSGMPLQFSLWKGDEPLYGGQGYGGLSEVALLSIGGILHHAPALSALCNPTTNSFRRLHHSEGQPYFLGYSQQSQRTVCGIPMFTGDPRSKCIEVRTSDASCNPYLALAAILMAAIDGIQNKIEPGAPMAQADDRRSSPLLPRSLWDAIDCLEQDSEFLLRGDVFSQEMLDRWTGYKRAIERPAVESSPTLAEYLRYLDG